MFWQAFHKYAVALNCLQQKGNCDFRGPLIQEGKDLEATDKGEALVSEARPSWEALKMINEFHLTVNTSDAKTKALAKQAQEFG